MKTTLKKSVKILFATGLTAFLAACADTETSVARKPPVYTTTVTAVAPVAPAPAVVAAAAPGVTAAPAPDPVAVPPAATSSAVAAQEKVIVSEPAPPASLRLSPAVEEIIKLSDSGVEENVIVAFIENSPNNFALTSQEILYLNDVGVSTNVVSAMIKKSGTKTMAAAPAQSAPAAAAPQIPIATDSQNPYPVVSSAPEGQAPVVVQQAPAAEPPAYVVAAPTTQVTYSYFYSSLSPYGYWVDVPGYGLCWQPSVAVVQPAWRPYCDRGNWMYSDVGWYWHSDYSWGWAPFHYGRWCRPSGYGWVWLPDTTWGPSWVTWRHTGTHFGWAPLPPGASYRSGVGFTFYDSHVSLSFGFGLSHEHYTFVPRSHFVDRNIGRHAVPVNQSVTVYKDSTVVNNYIVGSNNTIVNEGIGRDRVAAATHTEIRKAAVRESPASSTAIRGERLERSGSTPVIYRPPAPPVKTDTLQVMRTQQETRRTASFAPAAGTSLPSNRSSLANAPGGRPAPVATPAPETARGAGVSPRPETSTAVRSTPANPTVPNSAPALGSRPAPAANQPAERQSIASTPSVQSRPGAPIPSTTQSSSSPLPQNRPAAVPNQPVTRQSVTTTPTKEREPVTGTPAPAPQSRVVRGNEPISVRPSPLQSVAPAESPSAGASIRSEGLRGAAPNISARPQAVLPSEASRPAPQSRILREAEPVVRSAPSQSSVPPIVPPIASTSPDLSRGNTPASPPQIISRPTPYSRGPAVYELPTRQEAPRSVPIPNYQSRVESMPQRTIPNLGGSPAYTPPAYTPPVTRSIPSSPSYAPPVMRSVPSAPSYTPPITRSVPSAPAYTPPVTRSVPSAPPSYTPPATRSAPVPSAQPSNNTRDERRR